MENNQGEIMPDKTEVAANVGLGRSLTFGEKLVGLTFNPSGNEKVNCAKQLCAELADLVHNEFFNPEQTERTQLDAVLYDHAIGEILNAQMNAVKFLTNQH